MSVVKSLCLTRLKKCLSLFCLSLRYRDGEGGNKLYDKIIKREFYKMWCDRIWISENMSAVCCRVQNNPPSVLTGEVVQIRRLSQSSGTDIIKDVCVFYTVLNV